MILRFSRLTAAESHPFWKSSDLKKSCLPERAFKDSEDRTGVLCMNGLIRASASFIELISAAYFCSLIWFSDSILTPKKGEALLLKLWRNKFNDFDKSYNNLRIYLHKCSIVTFNWGKNLFYVSQVRRGKLTFKKCPQNSDRNYNVHIILLFPSPQSLTKLWADYL